MSSEIPNERPGDEPAFAAETDDDRGNGSEVPPRDPAPETEAGGSRGGSDAGEEDPASPEAIENDPSTAGGPTTDLPDGVERLRGG